ncbi:MAG: L-2-amino-thiazoline-4-carboxylic acid hydrolase [Dehalococcoidia bacterium]|nr:L-2-amino-thiazoline-4-carboxylic acid hydrolase [Dehalococcoidia bacterium]
MPELNDKQIADFFHRSYTAVDGLWFMKAEEKYGFDAALDLDDEVWKVFPKVQARALKDMTRMTFGLEALRECFTAKLAVEGFQFDVENLNDGFRVRISHCPWHDAMVKSGREALSGKVGARICGTEYSVWAVEFGSGIRFERKSEICTGAERCVLEFAQ